MKALEAGVVTQQDAVASRPVLLFILGLDVGDLRFCATRENVTFPAAGNVYTAKAIEMGNIKQSRDNQIAKVTVAFDDVVKDMTGYNNAEKFEGKSLSIWKVYRDAFGAANLYNELFFGYMLEPKNIDDRWMMIDVIAGSILQERNLLQYYQDTCNHIFGNTQCNKDGLADLTALTAAGTADSGSASTLADNALTQVADFWNYGRIEIIKGGIYYYRDIIDFVANVSAQGTITMGGIAIADETFTIGGQVFTWKAARGGAGEVTIGANAPAAVTNIVTAVTADLATVTAVDDVGDTVIITSILPQGAPGNLVVFTEASTNMAMDGGGTLGGTTAGVDAVVTFDVELHVAVAAADAYTIYKGCSQTWNACQANEAWGPSGDNKANFLGFIHLGDNLR